MAAAGLAPRRSPRPPRQLSWAHLVCPVRSHSGPVRQSPSCRWRASCVVACGRQQKVASTSSKLTSAILTIVPAAAGASDGKTSSNFLPAARSAVSTVMSMCGWPLQRRMTSAPVYPEAPSTATRALPPPATSSRRSPCRILNALVSARARWQPQRRGRDKLWGVLRKQRPPSRDTPHAPRPCLSHRTAQTRARVAITRTLAALHAVPPRARGFGRAPNAARPIVSCPPSWCGRPPFVSLCAAQVKPGTLCSGNLVCRCARPHSRAVQAHAAAAAGTTGRLALVANSPRMVPWKPSRGSSAAATCAKT